MSGKPNVSSDASSGRRRKVPLLRIFLSSPGDVAEERAAARALIDSELLKLPSLRGRLAVELIAWDDPAASIPLLATEAPQDLVNAARPRPATCDIVIVMLWSRMGTPLPDTLRKPNGEPYLSGTEWEYEDAVTATGKSRPQVLVYRRNEKPKLDIDDPDFADKAAQFQQVAAFFTQLRALKRGVNEYATPEDFRVLLRQHLEDLLHRLLRALGGDVDTAPVAPEIPAAYIDWLRRGLERVELLGVKEGRSVTLSSVYVPAMMGVDDGIVRAAESVGYLELFPRGTALQRLNGQSLYVAAPAGAGKSTFCRWVALQSIADAEITHAIPAPKAFAEPVPASLRGRLPLLVPLREFWRGMDCGRGQRTWKRADMERALAAWIDASPPEGLTGALLLAHLAAGGALLLLDGLDEVAVTDVRGGVTLFPRELLLSGLADALPAWLKAGNRVLLTSRPYGLDAAGLHRLGLPPVELEPLPGELQELFVRRWFHTLGKPDRTADLIATLDGRREELAPLIENPMLLTAVCVLYDNGGRLPDDRYELYRSIVAGVLHNRYPGEAAQRDPVERRLEAIALGMHQGDAANPRLTPAAEIGWVEVERLLGCFAALNPAYETNSVEVAQRREDLLNHSGLLVPRPNERAAFCHLSFQEFLAAQRLVRAADDIEGVFRERGAVAEWRPTLLFLFAAQIANRDAGWGLGLLGRLIADQDRAAVKANPAPAVFIAEALELCLAKKYTIPEVLAERFRCLALDAIEDEVELKARQALGLCLGRLGDPRIRSLRDPQAYVEVPAGVYPYGEKGGTIGIAEPFRIGRYPVTNSQYADFMADGGYRERRWWSDDGWAWLQKEKVTEPWFWRDRRWNSPNQPVVGVSFWEAEACSAWAGGRLPSEREWEAAARGPKGFTYPWGNAWQDGICNTKETGLRGTSPVGLFLRSRQVDLGIEDVAGNVWEWCASLFDSNRKELADVRVLRGGSWNGSRHHARAAFRLRSHPLDRGSLIGFRVVFVSRPSLYTDS